MIEAFQFEFMRNALAAGLLASVICGIMGTLVVVNRIVFLSGGIAHAAYGGIGLAFYFNWPYLPGTIGFSLFAAMVMAAISHSERPYDPDDRIGAVLDGMADGRHYHGREQRKTDGARQIGPVEIKRQPDTTVGGMRDAAGKKDNAVDHHEGAHNAADDAGQHAGCQGIAYEIKL